MKETVMTSVQAAYEPPYADIIEFAVERGFESSPVGDDPNYNPIDGTETLGRDEVTDPWHS